MEKEKKSRKEHKWSRHGGRHEGHRGEHHGSHGRHGEDRHKGHRGGGYTALAKPEGTQLLFIGSRSCSRHKGTEKMQLQQEGKLCFLCLEEIDWISGGYLDMITQAAEEIIEERKPKHLVIFGGCQIELLSTDYDTLTKDLSEKYEIDVHFHKGCHLVGYDRNAEE